MRKIRIAVFVSGGGTNLQALLDALQAASDELKELRDAHDDLSDYVDVLDDDINELESVAEARPVRILFAMHIDKVELPPEGEIVVQLQADEVAADEPRPDDRLVNGKVAVQVHASGDKPEGAVLFPKHDLEALVRLLSERYGHHPKIPSPSFFSVLFCVVCPCCFPASVVLASVGFFACALLIGFIVSLLYCGSTCRISCSMIPTSSLSTPFSALRS